MNNRDTYTYVKSQVQQYILRLSIEEQCRMLDANFGLDAHYIADIGQTAENGRILVAELDGFLHTESDWEEQIDIIISDLTTNQIIGLWSQIVGGEAKLTDKGLYVTWPSKQ